MSHPADRLFDLLPAVIRAADETRGYPLRDLLRVMDEQAGLLEDDVREMYENLFIETCQPWAIPYLGDLVGYKPLFVPPGTDNECDEDHRAALVNPRRAVANSISLSRRKGTYSVLDDLVTMTTGWPAAVEHLSGQTVQIKVWRLPSWPLTRVRPYYQPREINCYSLSVLGNDAPLFTRADPMPEDELTGDRIMPKPLTITELDEDLCPPEAPQSGTDSPPGEAAVSRYYGPDKSLCLFENGHPLDPKRLIVTDLSDWPGEPGGSELVDDQVAIDPARGRVMFPKRYRPKHLTANYHYGFAAAMGGGEYPRPVHDPGIGMSLFRAGHLVDQGRPFLRALWASVLPISEWIREEMHTSVLDLDLDAVDPAQVERELTTELNRLMQAHALPDALIDPTLDLDDEAILLRALDPRGARRIRLNRLLLEAIYPDTIRRSVGHITVTARGEAPVITDAVRALQDDPHPPLAMVIELADSGLYVEPVVINVPPFHTLVLRAAEGCRPTIVLPERSADIDDMVISCGHASRVVLDGIMVRGRAVRVSGNPLDVTLRHCTFVPGWELDQDCQPRFGSEPSLILSDIPLFQPWEDQGWSDCPPELLVPTQVRVDRSITGSILVQRDEVDAEPARLAICRSIVDATARDAFAVSAPGDRHAHAIVSVVSSTIIGRVNAHAIELAENSIFTGTVHVARRQIGCIRCCYVPPENSRTPRRHACQPDVVIQQAEGQAEKASEAEGVVPSFMAVPYGQPDYCRLDDIKPDVCATEILRGSDDESEMGVFHDLYVPQRISNLRDAIADFLPLGWIQDPIGLDS